MRLAFSAPHFNPRSPHGERHDKAQINFGALKFQSTLPARGATESCWRRYPRGHISIHAPRTGSDPSALLMALAQKHFNPRSPHGERHALRLLPRPPIAFQSTLPARGATGTTSTKHTARIFQSTLPARGATGAGDGFGARDRFQSTLPARGATDSLIYQQYKDSISIHAPRTGSDSMSVN